MLVLSRQRDESIVIGDNIVITIVDIRGDKVRLGIQAPVEIPVHRQEVYDAIHREKDMQAQQSGTKSVDDKVDSTELSGGSPDSVTEYHNILFQDHLSIYDNGLRLGGSYRSLKKELANYARL